MLLFKFLVSLFLIIQLMVNFFSFVKCMYVLMSNVLMKKHQLSSFFSCHYMKLM